MSRQTKQSVQYLVVSCVLGIMIGIVGCEGVSTLQPVSNTQASETAPVERQIPVGTETESVTETAQSTSELTVVPSSTAMPTETRELPDTEVPWVKTPQDGSQPSKSGMVAAVKADLASRLGLSQDEISVVNADAVTWNDTSLGCPEKGKMYAQVLTPGYQIILDYKSTKYDYRTNDVGFFKLCR